MFEESTRRLAEMRVRLVARGIGAGMVQMDGVVSSESGGGVNVVWIWRFF